MYCLWSSQYFPLWYNACTIRKSHRQTWKYRCRGAPHGGRGEGVVQLHSALRLRWEPISHPRWFPSRERHGIHWTWVWVGSRAGIDVLKKKKKNLLSLLGVNPQIIHPVALLLHRIHYPDIYTSHSLQYAIHSFISIQPLGWFSRNQSPVRRPVWLWDAAS